jgi:23S rRNA (cytosine1962-C5)-methyltransferase
MDDVFNYLEVCITTGRKFDVVMVDPPAFAKSRKSVPVAIKGYAKLNRLALQCLNEGGYLVTSSCSHHISETDFLESVNSGSIKSGRPVQLIYFNGASQDHPKLPSMEETSYLKFGVFKTT